MKKIIISLIIILLIVSAGFYFKSNILNIYQGFTKGVEDFQRTEIGQTISEVGKEIFTPAPLNIGGASNKVVLLQSKIIAETNLQRQENGLPALKENAELNAAALAKANDMFQNQYFEHMSPAGVDPGELVLNHGYEYIVAGENLLLGNFASEKEAVQAWMDSPGHRANILNNRFSEIGVAVVKGNYNGKSVWLSVQEFGLPLSTCSGPNVALKNEIEDKKVQLDQMSAQLDLEKNVIDGTNPRSAQYNSLINNYNQLVSQYQSLSLTVKTLISQYNNQINSFNQCVKGS